jgi:hypothetical protein
LEGRGTHCYVSPTLDILAVSAGQDRHRVAAGMAGQHQFENWLPE